MLDDRQYMRTPYRPAWSMTTILCVTLIACYIVQMLLERLSFGGGERILTGEEFVRSYLALSVDGLAQWRVYQLITFQFLHGGLLHLLGNLIGLYFFGRAVEDILGSAGMLKLYLASGTIGGILEIALQVLMHAVDPKAIPSGVVGASAGVFGLIAAYAMHAPDNPITLLIFYVIPLTFPLKFLLGFEAIISILGVIVPFFGKPSWAGGIAHGAHLGGMITGIIWMKWVRTMNAPFEFWQRRPARPKIQSSSPKRPVRAQSGETADVPPAEFISREVDPILEKISAHGIHSLTPRERQILEAARSKMARR